MSHLAPGVSVVIPVFNSERTLAELVERTDVVLRAAGLAFEIILVDDSSLDGSWEVVWQLAASRPAVRGVRMMRNYGQHNALLAGIRLAVFDRVVTMDDDLQHPPEEIPLLLDALGQGADVVYGAPISLSHSFVRNVLSRATKGALARAMGVPDIEDISAFRALRTELRAAFADYQSPQVLLDVLLSWGTTRFVAVRVRHDQRREGRSNYTLGQLFNQAMLIFTGFSTGPLRLASIVGFTFTLLGVALFLYVLVTYFVVGAAVPGFAFLASATAVFSGAQLFALGILGEYLARIFNRSMDRPPYAIASVVDGSDGDG